MNVREGARRLGIVIGVLGGTLGAFAGYPSARDLWNARAASKKFDSLMASPTMLKVAKAAVDYQKATSKVDSIASKYGGVRVIEPHTLTYANGALSYERNPSPPPDTLPADFFSKDGNETVLINADGIREAMINKSGIVRAVHLATGEWVEESLAPRLKSYLVPLLYPMLGFILPWGALRALTWVGAGFFEPNRL
jgi:hypothetical protein